MRWFRLHQRWGSCLALVALAVQLVMAAGHAHLDHAEPHGGDPAIAATAPPEPASSDAPQEPDRDHCPACALLHLTQALLAPTVPALPLPAGLDRPPPVATAAGLTASHPTLFQARAPPIA